MPPRLIGSPFRGSARSPPRTLILGALVLAAAYGSPGALSGPLGTACGSLRAAVAEGLRPGGAEATLEGAQRAFEEGLRAFEEARAYAAERPADREEISRRYRTAADRFVAAWKAGAASNEVFTNAGNAFAFAGDTGQAVLFYRRALAVDPGDGRARTALEYLRARLPIRKAEAGTATSILRSLFFWHEGLAFATRRTAFILAFPAAFACFAIALWRRRPFRLIGLLLLAVGLGLLGSMLVDALGGSLHAEAVVVTEVQGRRGDGRNYSPSHSQLFPPGTEVTILQERAATAPETGGAPSISPSSSTSTTSGGERWLRVRLLDGKESWIPAGVVEKVLP